MNQFAIFLRLPDGSRARAGNLTLTSPQSNGRYSASFEYEPAWLRADDAFSLDPESLPLLPSRFNGIRLTPPLAVFEDALPDAWGRKLIFNGVPHADRTDIRLIESRGANGLGAIEFIAASPSSPKCDSPLATTIDLLELLRTVEAFERGAALENDAFRMLLAAGSTAGGARPKALVVDDKQNHWIAKFPSKNLDGAWDMVGLEKASMDCAACAGIGPAQTELRTVDSRKILLVRRFDVTEHGGRRHMMSLSTLCKERADWTVGSYDALAEAVRRHSAAPTKDIARLFQQAIFNGLLGNTDDHLKNFVMLHDAGGYRLSPAFDLLPDFDGRREHCLSFGLQRYLQGRTDVLDMARRWGVGDPLGILDRIIVGVRRFEEFAVDASVPDENIAAITADIERRVARVTRG